MDYLQNDKQPPISGGLFIPCVRLAGAGKLITSGLITVPSDTRYSSWKSIRFDTLTRPLTMRKETGNEGNRY